MISLVFVMNINAFLSTERTYARSFTASPRLHATMTTLQPSREYAPGIHNGRAAVHLVNDVIANLLRVRGDNGEIFAEVNTFNHGIDHERFDSKTEQRKQACADIEHKHRGKRDERIMTSSALPISRLVYF